jgi:hypothetical protein
MHVEVWNMVFVVKLENPIEQIVSGILRQEMELKGVEEEKTPFSNFVTWA